MVIYQPQQLSEHFHIVSIGFQELFCDATCSFEENLKKIVGFFIGAVLKQISNQPRSYEIDIKILKTISCPTETADFIYSPKAKTQYLVRLSH
jgi:hypothetical protein